LVGQNDEFSMRSENLVGQNDEFAMRSQNLS